MLKVFISRENTEKIAIPNRDIVLKNKNNQAFPILEYLSYD